MNAYSKAEDEIKKKRITEQRTESVKRFQIAPSSPVEARLPGGWSKGLDS